MLLNEQKKQALELYVNQNHTQQQKANTSLEQVKGG
jgi:hypothetical protein